MRFSLLPSWSCFFGLSLGAALAGLVTLHCSAAPAPPLRYLFLVETSSAMAGQKESLLTILSGQLAGGLKDQMRNGDMFVVWTFAEQVSSDRYLPASWNRRAKDIVALRTTRSIAEIWFSGTARLDRAMAEVLKVARHSDNLTILILSSGTSTLVGTPFDEPVNATYHPPGLFLTTLVVKAGHMVRWSVQSSVGLGTSMSQPASTRELPSANQAVSPTSGKPEPKRTTGLAAGTGTERLLSAKPVAALDKTNSSPSAGEAPLRSFAAQPGEAGSSPLPGVEAMNDFPVPMLEVTVNGSVGGGLTPVQAGCPSVTSQAVRKTNSMTSPSMMLSASPVAKPENITQHATVRISAPAEANASLRPELQPPVDASRLSWPSALVPQHPASAVKQAARRSNPALPSSSASVVGRGRGFLIMGLLLLVCALAGLYRFVSARSGGEHASLISRSIAAPKG